MLERGLKNMFCNIEAVIKQPRLSSKASIKNDGKKLTFERSIQF